MKSLRQSYCKLLTFVSLMIMVGIVILYIKRRETHVTYLSAHIRPPRTSIFPYKYLPSPKLDKREIYLGNKEIAEMLDIICFVLEQKPSWAGKSSTDIERIIMHNSEEISSTLHESTVKLFSYIHHTVPRNKQEIPRPLGEIKNHLTLLNTKTLPTERRQLTCKKCFPYDFKNIITPKGLCKEGDFIYSVIIVTTVPGAVNRRMGIRKTWGEEKLKEKYSYKVIFLFGAGWPDEQTELLKKENEDHNDILMDDFIDNYYNLTQKVLMGFRWVLRECPQKRFVIRAADDTAIRISSVFSLLHKYGTDEAFQKYQVGSCFIAYKTYRAPDYKGYLSTLEYDQDITPPYALGTVFITSLNLTRELVEISPNIPFIANEDAYFGLALEQIGRGCHDIGGWQRKYIKHAADINEH